MAQRSFGNHWEIIPPLDFEQPKVEFLIYYGDTHDARKGKIMSATAEKTHRPNLDILVPREWRKSSSGDCYDKGDLKEKLQSYQAIAFLLPEVEPVHPDWLERLVYNSQGEGWDLSAQSFCMLQQVWCYLRDGSARWQDFVAL